MFTITVDKGVGKRDCDVRCNNCGFEIVNAQPARHLLPHVLECKSILDADKEEWIKYDAGLREGKWRKLVTPVRLREPSDRTPMPTITKRLFDSSRRTPGTSISTSKKSKKKKKKKLSREQRQMAIATAIFATGIPFRVVEDPFFRAMFDDEDDVPSRFQVAKSLLIKTYEREKAGVLDALSRQSTLSLVTDGWSNPRNESIINYVLVNPNMKPMFWKSTSAGGQAHTSECIAQQILEVIDDVEAVLGRKAVFSIVTDNAANMKGAWQILRSSGRGLICNGCASHTMNLLMRDVFKLEEFNWVLERAKTLTMFIKQRHALLDRFRAIQKHIFKTPGDKRRALALPVKTRWYSCEKCIRSVVDNRAVISATFADRELMRRFANTQDKVDEVQAIIADDGFWRRAAVVLRVVASIDECLAKFEMDTCCLSMIKHLFVWLKGILRTPAPHEEAVMKSTVINMVKEREKFLFTDSMRAAFLLDHSKPVATAGDDPIDVIASTVELAIFVGLPDSVEPSDFHNELVVFVRAKMNWTKAEIDKYAAFSPLDWWMLSTKYPRLKTFAIRLLSIPTSSAASERSWSIHGFIHSLRRNRLSSESVNKLVYSNIGEKGAADQILYQLYPEASEFIEHRDGEVEVLDDPDQSENGGAESGNTRQTPTGTPTSNRASLLFTV